MQTLYRFAVICKGSVHRCYTLSETCPAHSPHCCIGAVRSRHGRLHRRQRTAAGTPAVSRASTNTFRAQDKQATLSQTRAACLSPVHRYPPFEGVLDCAVLVDVGEYEDRV